MPNHITNKLRIEGSKKQISELFETIKYDDETGKIDFNKIVKKPESLSIESGSLGELGLFGLYGKRKQGYSFLSDSSLKNRYAQLDDERKAEADRLGELYKKNIDQHGHTDWYSWSIAHWGTKWNAYSTPDERDTEDTIYFQTAWSGVINLIKVLSAMYPVLKFHYSYADEDTGCNVGKFIISQGQIDIDSSPINESKEAYKLAIELTDAGDYYRYNPKIDNYEYFDQDE